MIEVPISRTKANIAHNCLLGGMSKIESSFTRNLENDVFTGVLRVFPSGRGCTKSPLESGTARRTCTSFGRCNLKIMYNRGRLQRLEDRITKGYSETAPITRKREAYIRKNVGSTVTNILL